MIPKFKIEKDPITGESIMIFPEGFLEEHGWQLEDNLQWIIEGKSAILKNLSLEKRKQMKAI